MRYKTEGFQRRRSGEGKPDLRFMKLSCWMIFLLGFESGGFQLALLKIAREFGITNTEMGGLVTVQFAAMMVMPAIFGAFSDTLGKKRILLCFSQLFTAGCLMTALLPYYWGIVLGIFCIGSGYSVCECVLTASLFDEYPGSGTLYAGWTQGFFSAGAVMGPLVCDLLVRCGIGDWRNVFFLMAFCYALSGVLLILIPMKPAKKKQKTRDTPADAESGGGAIHPWYVSVPVLFCIILMICYVGMETGIAYFLDAFVNLELQDSGSASWMLAAFWLLMIPGRVFCGKTAGKAHKALLLCFGALVILTVCWQNCKSTFQLALIICCAGAACGMVWPLLMGTANEEAKGRSGRVSGLMTMGSGIGGALWPVMFGKMMDLGGIRNSLWLIVITGCGAAGIILLKQYHGGALQGRN